MHLRGLRKKICVFVSLKYLSSGDLATDLPPTASTHSFSPVTTSACETWMSLSRDQRVKCAIPRESIEDPVWVNPM